MQIKTSLSRSVCIVIIYRPPLPSNRDCTADYFMDEFRSLLEQYVTDSSSLLITGDFNLHVDNNLDKSSQDFLALIDSFNFKQHICSLTHRAGHILDLLITRDDDQLVTSVFLFMTPLSLTILLLIVLCPLRNLCLQRNKLFIVGLRILILIFSSVTSEVLPSSVIRQMNLMI